MHGHNRLFGRLGALLILVSTLLGICGCGDVQQGFVVHKDCRNYVRYYLEAVFYGDYTDYMKNGGDGPTAVSLHDQMIKYFVDIAYCKYGIARDCVTDVTSAEYEVMADGMLKKAAFEIVDYRMVNDVYKVDVSVTPLVFWQLTTAFCQSVYNGYMNLISSGELASYSVTEWKNYMSDYSDEILEAMKLVQARASGYGQQKTVTITVQVDANGNFVMDNSEIYAVCDYVLGLK